MRSCVLRLLLIQTPSNAESICRKLGKKLRRPALHAFIIHCGKKSARIAPPNTLTDPYIWFLPKAQPYFNFMTRTPKSKPFIFTLRKYTVLLHWWVVYAFILFWWNTPCLHCWAKHQQNYIVVLYPTLTHCWDIPYLFTWLSNSNFNTLLSYTQS